MSVTYQISVKDLSTWTVSSEGDVRYDGTRRMAFAGIGTWRIIGFSRRIHSRRIISLSEAADGENIGQGWVHDLDHGAHRIWAGPSSRRAVCIRRIIS